MDNNRFKLILTIAIGVFVIGYILLFVAKSTNPKDIKVVPEEKPKSELKVEPSPTASQDFQPTPSQLSPTETTDSEEVVVGEGDEDTVDSSFPAPTDVSPEQAEINRLEQEMKDQELYQLPEEFQEQIGVEPELPDDLKQQLNSPPPLLPEDLRKQLEEPLPPIPDDILKALEEPERTVTIEEVNGPEETDSE